MSTESSTTRSADQNPLGGLDLPLPSLGIGSLARQLGPGLVLMMTGIGTSHLVTAPVAGGHFEYALLWCLPVAYIVKYFGFEAAIRFTQATGRSLLDAYSTSWKKSLVWDVLVATVLQLALGQAGRLIAAAAVCFYAFRYYFGVDLPGLTDDGELAAYATVLGVLSTAIILKGRYVIVEWATKAAAGLLIACVLLVYAMRPAPPEELVHFLQIEMPAGSALVILALLGLMPTGLDVSLQMSEWGSARRVGMGQLRRVMEANGQIEKFDPFRSGWSNLKLNPESLPAHAREYRKRWLKISMFDFQVGHVVSFVTASIFLLLAAVWLFPTELSGNAVMGEIAQMLTTNLGAHFMLVFLLGAFAATFSTAFNYFDGWPRVVAACCRNLFQSTASVSGIGTREQGNTKSEPFSEENIYIASMLFSLCGSVAIIAGAPRPVFLVLIASALSYLIAPVIYFANIYYCRKAAKDDDDGVRPSAFVVWGGIVGFVLFASISVLLFAQRLIFQ